MNTFSIVLKHIGGERKTFIVEFVAATYVSIRWGQSGIYDLNLAKNCLTARSQKAQRKGKAHWEAEDIHAVRKMVKLYIAERDGRSEEGKQLDFKGHVESMPVYK